MLKILLMFVVMAASTAAGARDAAVAKPESVGMSSAGLERILPFMQGYVDRGELAGIVTLVARHGKIVHFEQTGKLDLDSGAALQKDSLFRIYSMSKPITAVALMMLFEQGKFDLDDPVAKFLPEFKDTKVLVDGEEVAQDHPFTVRELLSHRAGLTYGFFGETDVDKQYTEAKILSNTDLAEMITALAPIPLLYQPGSNWVYSVAVDVTGRLVEVLSGQPLDEYLDSQVFTPLNMHDTFFEVPKDKRERFGTNHYRDVETGELKVLDRPADSKYTQEVTFFSGGGGLVSTAMDYYRFAQMLLNGGELDGVRILSPKTIELMARNQLPEGMSSGLGEMPGIPGNFGFGLGFGVIDGEPLDNSGSNGIFYWGGAAGTIFWVDPEEDLLAVLMVQQMSSPYPLRSRLETLIYSAVTD